uniref:Uncharacterized protein n=1 Tax=Octopus bimaculoides TaxID=37653 RepID=A0A0L8FIN5_OCTBM
MATENHPQDVAQTHTKKNQRNECTLVRYMHAMFLKGKKMYECTSVCVREKKHRT